MVVTNFSIKVEKTALFYMGDGSMMLGKKKKNVTVFCTCLSSIACFYFVP